MFGPACSSRMFPSSFKQESPYFLPLKLGGLLLLSCLINHGSSDVLWLLMLGYKTRCPPPGRCNFGALCHHDGRLPAPTTERERERRRESGKPQRFQPADGWAFRAHGDSSPSPITTSRGTSKNLPAEPRTIPWLLFMLLSFGVVCCATADN